MKIQRCIVGVLAGTSLSAVSVPVMANTGTAETDAYETRKDSGSGMDVASSQLLRVSPIVAPTLAPESDVAVGSWNLAVASQASAAGSSASLTDQRVAGTDLPAVSGANGAFFLASGAHGTGAAVVAGGEFSAPLSHNIGLQIDEQAGYATNVLNEGTSAQLFWRNPNSGLLGLYASYSFQKDINGFDGNDPKRFFSLARGGADAAVYYGPVTIQARSGVEWGTDRTRFFDSADLIYYPADDFKLSIGQRYSGGNEFATAGLEYQFYTAEGAAVSMFADASYSSDENKTILSGLRIHFGSGGKTLIRRDREDDPDTLLALDQAALTTQNQLAQTPTSGPTSAPPTTAPPTTGAPTTGAPPS